MKGSVIINNKDVADFGAFILRGGDNDLLTMPERKQPKMTSWYEYDGIDADLTEVFFNERKLKIDFYLSADNAAYYKSRVKGFYDLITGGSITMYSREFDRSFTFRYLTCPEFEHKGGLYKAGDKRGKFTVEFSMDDPLQLFTDPTILQPRSSYVHTSHVLLNGIDLGAFGIIVNECYSSMLKLPAIKKPLTRSFSRRSGLIAFTRKNPTFETREISIQCTMRARSRTEFYYNYEALFNNLAKTEALQLDSYLGQAKCYYSKMLDSRKMGTFSNGIMIQFTLRLIQI